MSNRKVRFAFLKWLVVATVLWTGALTPNVAYPQDRRYFILSITLLLLSGAWTIVFGAHLTRHGRPNRIVRCSFWAATFLACWSIFLIVLFSDTPGIFWSLNFYLFALGAMWLLSIGVLAAFMAVGSYFVQNTGAAAAPLTPPPATLVSQEEPQLPEGHLQSPTDDTL